jgi:hypothetical protein
MASQIAFACYVNGYTIETRDCEAFCKRYQECRTGTDPDRICIFTLFTGKETPVIYPSGSEVSLICFHNQRQHNENTCEDNMNTARSVWMGWAALMVAGAGAYYFAKRDINAHRREQELKGIRGTEYLECMVREQYLASSIWTDYRVAGY